MGAWGLNRIPKNQIKKVSKCNWKTSVPTIMCFKRCIYYDTDSDLQSEFNSFFNRFVSDNNVSVLYTGFKANLFIFRSFDDVGSCPSKAPLTFVVSQP